MSVKLISLLFIVNSATASTYYVESKGGVMSGFKLDNGFEKSDERQSGPLGSIWKLFAYTYLKENKISVAPYTCKSGTGEEAFCCVKGESIDMATALKRSCGLYFSKERTKISRTSWDGYWNKKGLTYDWLVNYDQMNGSRYVPVTELFSVLAAIRPVADNEVLREVVLQGTAVQGLSEFGSYPRIKTFTWDDPVDPKKYIGGFAGWLPDGTLVWLKGEGRSHEVIQRTAPLLEKHWSFKQNEESECVSVHFFRNYPISKVIKTSTGKEVTDGPLNGTYKIIFKNGKEFTIEASPDTRVGLWKQTPVITGKLNLTNYIARVIDREFNHRDEEATLALSIVARTYLYQNGRKTGACYDAPDSSAFQRVSASKPSDEALKIANKTADIVLTEKNVRYHHDVSGPNKISWTGAVNLQNKNLKFPEILLTYFPGSQLRLHSNKKEAPCVLLDKANLWLRKEEKKWKRELVTMNGFEAPSLPKVCRSTLGSPFTNIKKNEIYIEQFEETEDLISLTHEWIHIAFQNHPMRHDELKIDQIARQLNIKR